MGLADAVIAAGILGGALYLLYRSLWKSGGSCHGCDGGACRPSSRGQAGLVRLGSAGTSCGSGTAHGTPARR